ncbi:hypothetical protein BCR44DRAFT_57489 [Catenaria anguillulae PL171]|uniref:Uncharacterized protein n=1 Tax=Catenaria anguillulae PL171 TaxID=765915 RepID=A0A1Y2HPS7_9FUNG|nr:hypothetical protein BCR44DRAFT_57489 [Catenaria anguillulae PL171]
MKSSGDAFAFRWDAGVILALVLVCVFAMCVGTIVLRHYLRRRRHRLTMAALANMRSGGGGGGGGGVVAGRDPTRVATINGLAGRQGQVSSMARAQEGSGAMYAAAHRGTMSSNRFYSPHHQAYLGGIGSAATAPAVKRPLSGSGHRGGGIARPPASRSVAALSSTMGNSKGSSSATLAPSPSSSSSSSPITPLLQVPPQLPLPAGLTINTSLAQDSQIGGYDDTLDVVATKRQTVHSIQWIPAPSSAIFSPLDMADSNSTIDFLDALQLAPPVPQLPQPALLRVCNTGSSCMSIASDYSSSPLSASPASSYCSIASSATVRPSSTASSVASFASVATVGPSSSIASSHRAPGMTPSRAFSASTTGSAPLIPSTHRSTSLSHMFPVGVRGSAPPSVMSATSSGTGSYFGSPQIGPVKALPRSTSLSPLQI